MRRYQVRPGSHTLLGVMDEIADTVAATVPEVSRAQAAACVRLVFAGRCFQTASCGRAHACQALGRRVLGEDAAPLAAEAGGPACGFYDLDARDLPNIYAAALADRAEAAPFQRAFLEHAAAGAFARALAPYLYECDSCGAAAVCDAVPSDPFAA